MKQGVVYTNGERAQVLAWLNAEQAQIAFLYCLVQINGKIPPNFGVLLSSACLIYSGLAMTN